MGWHRAWVVAALLALGACAGTPGPGSSPVDPAVVGPAPEPAAILDRLARDYDRAFLERPFELGSMALVSTEGGEIRTWRLVPCQGGRALCDWTEAGPVGTWRATPDWLVVTGLHGRTFWLGYGGQGWAQQGDAFVPLAWDARTNGPGPNPPPYPGRESGTDAALETAAPH